MKNDITELVQRMRTAAGKLGVAQWQTRNGFSGTEVIVKGSLEKGTGCVSFQPVAADIADTKTARAIALFSPANVLALVEALEKAQCAGSVNNQWKPDVCPITGRRFFLWIEHPEFGYVPTYGGPYDSYTIPTRDGDGEFSCERYDHDFGGWVDGECVGAYLIDDDEQSRVYELEQRIAELEREQEQLRPVGVMSEKAFHRLENSECRFIALWPRPGIFLPRKRPEDGVIVYARTAATAATAGIKVEADSLDADVSDRNQPGVVVAVHIDAGDFVKVEGQVYEVKETDFDDHDVTLWFVGGETLKCAAGCQIEVVSAPVEDV